MNPGGLRMLQMSTHHVTNMSHVRHRLYTNMSKVNKSILTQCTCAIMHAFND